VTYVPVPRKPVVGREKFYYAFVALNINVPELFLLWNLSFDKIWKDQLFSLFPFSFSFFFFLGGGKLQTWIVGKWITPREQKCAPPGTHFHQFVVPPIMNFRKDCTYGELAAMKLPQDAQGLGNCEVNATFNCTHLLRLKFLTVLFHYSKLNWTKLIICYNEMELALKFC